MSSYFCLKKSQFQRKRSIVEGSGVCQVSHTAISVFVSKFHTHIHVQTHCPLQRAQAWNDNSLKFLLYLRNHTGELVRISLVLVPLWSVFSGMCVSFSIFSFLFFERPDSSCERPSVGFAIMSVASWFCSNLRYANFNSSDYEYGRHFSSTRRAFLMPHPENIWHTCIFNYAFLHVNIIINFKIIDFGILFFGVFFAIPNF